MNCAEKTKKTEVNMEQNCLQFHHNLTSTIE